MFTLYRENSWYIKKEKDKCDTQRLDILGEENKSLTKEILPL